MTRIFPGRLYRYSVLRQKICECYKRFVAVELNNLLGILHV